MDFEVKLARKMLLKTRSPSRKSMLKAFGTLLKRVRVVEKKKITRALKKLGVDWSSKKAGKASFRLSYKVLPAKRKKGKKRSRLISGRMVAGGTYRLRVTLRNNSKHTAYRVRAMTRSKFWFLNRREFIFGKIKPKKRRRWDIEVKIPKWVSTQTHPITLDIRATNKVKQKEKILVDIQGKKRPRFAFSYALRELSGNGDGLIQPGESFSMRISVRNQGPGKALKVVAEMRNEGGRELFIKRGRVSFGELKPNAWRTGEFQFSVNKDVYMKKALDIRLKISDNKLFTSVLDRIKLPIRSEDIAPMDIKKRWLKVAGQTTWLYSGAAVDAPKVALARRNTKLKGTGRLGPFYRVEVPARVLHKPIPAKYAKKSKTKALKTLSLWVMARDVKPFKKGGRRSVVPYWQYKTPAISIKGSSKPIRTSQATFRLKGQIRNNVPLLDTYILVNRKKIFYRSLRNLPKLQFSLPVKLKKGRNSIIIVARETKYFVGNRELIVHYEPAATTKTSSAKKIKPTK